MEYLVNIIHISNFDRNQWRSTFYFIHHKTSCILNLVRYPFVAILVIPRWYLDRIPIYQKKRCAVYAVSIGFIFCLFLSSCNSVGEDIVIQYTIFVGCVNESVVSSCVQYVCPAVRRLIFDFSETTEKNQRNFTGSKCPRSSFKFVHFGQLSQGWIREGAT